MMILTREQLLYLAAVTGRYPRKRGNCWGTNRRGRGMQDSRNVPPGRG